MAVDDASIVQGGRIYNVLQRAYRNRTYRPARYYLTWYFLASLWATIDFMVLGAASYLEGGISLFESRLVLVLPGFFSGLFLTILSTYFGMLGSSPHLLEGDRGIYSLGSMPATSPAVTKATFFVNRPEIASLYDPKYANARITRNLVWRWGRKGGCTNWPGKAGGKAEGYFAAVAYSWEEAEYTVSEGTGALAKTKILREVIEKQPCPRCNRDRKTPDDWRGFVRVPALSTTDLASMSTSWPGTKRGNVIDLRMQVMADRYLEEIPDVLANAIQADEEFRASSRVDVMFDPLPDGPSLGSVLDHNMIAHTFGLEYALKRARKNIVDLNQEISVVSQLAGGRTLGSSGIGQPGQPPR